MLSDNDIMITYLSEFVKTNLWNILKFIIALIVGYTIIWTKLDEMSNKIDTNKSSLDDIDTKYENLTNFNMGINQRLSYIEGQMKSGCKFDGECSESSIDKGSCDLSYLNGEDAQVIR